jgi:hypothetical protein
MTTFTIQYPQNVITVLGRITTNKEEWDNLEYPTKVILLGSFVNALVPEYEYCAVDFIPSADKPWEHDINNQHIVMTTVCDGSTLVFSLERRTFIPCNLVEI